MTLVIFFCKEYLMSVKMLFSGLNLYSATGLKANAGKADYIPVGWIKMI